MGGFFWLYNILFIKISCMKNICILFILLIVNTIVVFSQIVAPNRDFMEYEWRKVTERNSRHIKVECEDCNLFTDFVEGHMFLHNGENISCRLNYNLFYNEVQLIRGVDTLFVANRFHIDSVLINNRTFLYSLYDDSDGTASAFVEKICNGRVKLLLFKKKTFIPETPNAPYTIKEEAYFKNESMYFYKVDNENAFVVDSKRDIFNRFPSKKKYIKKFIKSNKIKFSDRESLIKLCRFLSLL